MECALKNRNCKRHFLTLLEYMPFDLLAAIKKQHLISRRSPTFVSPIAYYSTSPHAPDGQYMCNRHLDLFNPIH